MAETLPNQCHAIARYGGPAKGKVRVSPKDSVEWAIGVSGQPYFVVVPNYVGNSAGIRALYVLVRSLNRLGMRAFAVDLGLGGPDSAFPGVDYAVPVLTRKLCEDFMKAGAQPIVIYPETVHGNPLNAECVVRYVGNFPGLLGGPDAFPEGDSIWAFGRSLARAAGSEKVLTIPISDPRYWTPPRGEVARTEEIVYAPKFRLLGGIPKPHRGALEITRNQPTGLDLRRLLRRSKRLYLYENSALGTEAILCGCPVVWMPNPFLQAPALLDEFGWVGHTWGDDDAKGIRHATATVDVFRRKYIGLFHDFPGRLRTFIQETQALTLERPAAQFDIDSIREPVEVQVHIETVEVQVGPDRTPDWLAAEEALASSQEFIRRVTNSRSWRVLQVWRRFRARVGLGKPK